jgi:hypothetical protein
MEEMEKRMEEMERAMEQMEKASEEIEKAASELPEVPEIPEAPEIEEVETEGDTTRISWGNNSMVIVEDGEDVSISTNGSGNSSKDGAVNMFYQGRNRVFQGFDFGFSTMAYSEDYFDTDVPEGLEWTEVNTINSINWALNFVEADIRLIGEHLKFSTGLGYNVKNFSFENDSTMLKVNNTITGLDLGNDYDKNRFRTAYLTVPAIIHLNTNKNPERSFRVGAGVIGGLRVFQTYRTKLKQDGQKTKTSTKGGWNANDFILDARGLVGFGSVNLYVNYSLTPLLENDRGPEMYPISFGISFVNNWD